MIINLIDQMRDKGLKMLVALLFGLVKFLRSLFLSVAAFVTKVLVLDLEFRDM